VIIFEESETPINSHGKHNNAIFIDGSFTLEGRNTTSIEGGFKTEENVHDGDKDKNQTSSIMREWKQHDIPEDGFAGCLLLKDDNDRLAEWLAYHWLVLPLKYIVVAIDPTGTTSPKAILDTWDEANMGIEIELWNDADYGHWINEEIDEKHKHRDRQKRFLMECEKFHKQKGRTWLAIIDPDEYITYNLISGDDPHNENLEDIPEKFVEPQYMKEMQRIRKNLGKVLHEEKTIFSFIAENRDKEPWVSEQCNLMPRLFFSSIEHSNDVLSKANVQQYGFDPMAFSTLRYFHHANKGGFNYNHYGKVIVDLTRIKWREIKHDMYSVHRPNEISCLPPTKPYSEGILRVHHYLGSWEQYSSRSDVRRSRARFDKFAAVDHGKDFQLQYWLQRFVDKVGVTKAKRLLNSAGLIDKGTHRLLDEPDFINVESRFDRLEGVEETLTYLFDEDGSVVEVRNAEGKLLSNKLIQISADILSM
jgi:hypothetical protein